MNNSLVKKNLKVSWKISTIDKQWYDMPVINLSKDKSVKANVVIKLNSKKQEINGFGGAFNEKGWVAWLKT